LAAERLGFWRSLLVRLLLGYLWVLRHSMRWRREIDPATQAMAEKGEAFVGCFSHGRLTLMESAWPFRRDKLTVLASSHRDGRMIGEIFRRRGLSVVLGSGSGPDKGGREALASMRDSLERGRILGVTPDGPKGPFLRVKGGCVKVASDAGVPLVAIAMSARPAIRLKTWDNFLLPLPFARGMTRMGAPVPPPAERRIGANEAARRAVEDSLIALTQACDRDLGLAEAVPGEDGGRRPKSRRRHT